MSMAPQELENTASKYASEAIKFDSQEHVPHQPTISKQLMPW